MKAITRGIPSGARLIEAKDYNPRNSNDAHLSIVLCALDRENRGSRYATWLHNDKNFSADYSDSSLCFDGHYFDKLSDAAKDFEQRGIR